MNEPILNNKNAPSQVAVVRAQWEQDKNIKETNPLQVNELPNIHEPTTKANDIKTVITASLTHDSSGSVEDLRSAKRDLKRRYCPDIQLDTELNTDDSDGMDTLKNLRISSKQQIISTYEHLPQACKVMLAKDSISDTKRITKMFKNFTEQGTKFYCDQLEAFKVKQTALLVFEQVNQTDKVITKLNFKNLKKLLQKTKN